MANSGTETGTNGVNLVSAISSIALGGTAAYIRSLGEALVRQGIPVQGIARSVKTVAANLQYHLVETEQDSSGPFPTALISAQKGLKFPAHRLAALFGRPPLAKAGAAAAASLFGTPLDEAALPGSKIFHFVGNGWEALGFGAVEAARRRKGAVVVTPFVHPDTWGDSSIDIELYKQVDMVLAASKSEIEHLVSRGVNPRKIRQIDLAPANYLAGDADRFRARHHLGERPLVLFIARKQKYKGYHTLRKAMWSVCESVPDTCLVAIGSDIDEGDLPPVPKGAFIDLGEIAPPPTGDIHCMADALAAADVFCMPSTAEAFGIVYVEAWSYGKPVIGGPAPAVRELVQDGVAGFCVTEQDEKQVADLLIRLLQDHKLRDEMGKAGKKLVKDRYNWEMVAAEHLRLYSEALNSRSSQGH